MNWASRIWMTFLGAITATAGVIFAWYLYSAWEKASLTNDWVEVPATIIASAIDGSQTNRHGLPKYVLEVSYRYRYGGEDFLSDKIRRHLTTESSSLREIERTAKRYPNGGTILCYVNPEDPSEAILKRDTKAAIKSIWFPGIFVVGGIGIICAALRPRKVAS